MAIFHSHASVVSRSTGRSAVAAAAYINGKELVDERLNTTRLYNKNHEIHNNILTPENAPAWSKETESLWNKAESFEDELANYRFRGHSDPIKNAKSMAAKEEYINSAQTAQTLECALPIELNNKLYPSLIEEFLNKRFVSRGLVVEYAIHFETGNPHFHAMITRRAIEGNSFSTTKDRDILAKDEIKETRRMYAEVTNSFLEREGLEVRVDHRSFKEMGLDIEPTLHKGWQAHELEKSGDYSRIICENEEIRQKNIDIIFNDPSQIIKEVALKKTIFTKDDIANAIMNRVGGDEVLFSILNERVNQIEIPNEISKSLVLDNNKIIIANNNNNPNEKLYSLNNSDALRPEYKYEGIKTLEEQRAFFNILSENSSKYADNLLIDLEESVLLGSNLNSKLVYTSKHAKDLETHIFERSDSANENNSFKVRQYRIDHFKFEKEKEFGEGKKLSEEQSQGIDYLCSGSNIRVLEGRAGTGKTTLLKVVADSYKDAGYRVLGTSFQGKVVDIMAKDIKIEAKTLDSYIRAWQKHDLLEKQINEGKLFGSSLQYAKGKLEKLGANQLTSKDVVIVDEANMISINLWKPLLDRIDKSEAKLIVVQDPAQIKSFDGSDIGRGLIGKYGSFKLYNIQRQKLDWQKEASSHLNDHNIEDGLKPYFKNGKINWHQNKIQCYNQIVKDYVDGFMSDTESYHLFMTYLNTKVGVINKAIHNKLVENGTLTKHFNVDGKEFSVNERIVFKDKNENWEKIIKTIYREEGSQSIGVKNGAFGTIIDITTNKIGRTSFKVKLDDNRIIKFNPNEYSHFDYGYGITVNKAEGITCDKSYVLFDEKMNANLILIAMTRHREDCRGYVIEDEFSDFKDVVTKLSNSQKKELIADYTINEEIKPYYDRVKSYKELSIESASLLEYITNTIPDNKEVFDHKEWQTLQEVSKQRNTFALEILQEYDKHSIFVSQANIKKRNLEVNAGFKQRLLSDKEINASFTVEKYFEVASKTRELWNEIKTTHPGWMAKTHDKYNDYNDLRIDRDSLSAVIAESKTLHRQFFRVTYKEVSSEIEGERSATIKIDYFGNEVKGTHTRWATVMQQASDHNKRQLSLSYIERLTPQEKENYNSVKSYIEHRDNVISFVSGLKEGSKDGVYQFPEIGAFNVHKEQKEIRDKLALKIVESHEKYENYFSLLNIKEEKLLEHAIRGESLIAREQSLAAKETGLLKQPKLNATYDQKFIAYDYERVKAASSANAKEFAYHLLGDANRSLSSSTELRYGSKGSFKIDINGPKAGRWIDFERDESGNIIKLISSQLGLGYKESIEYAAKFLGVPEEERVVLFKQPEALKTTPIEEAELNSDEVRLKEKKLAWVNSLYKKSIPIIGTIGEKYLREHRNITEKLPESLRFIESLYETKTMQNLPALVSFAQNSKGKLAAAQVTYLGPVTNNKAKLVYQDLKTNDQLVAANKRTHGLPSGSFVYLQKGSNDKPIYIAEGVETALSVKEVGTQGTIVASLGIHNIKNISKLGLPSKELVICADNDGPDAGTNKTIEKAGKELIEQGYKVTVIKPREIGTDFNDLLKSSGKEAVKEYFSTPLQQNNEVAGKSVTSEDISVKGENILTNYEYQILDREVKIAKAIIIDNKQIVQNAASYEKELGALLRKIYKDVNAHKLLNELGSLSEQKAADILNAVQNDPSSLGTLKGNTNLFFMEDEERKEARMLSLELHVKLRKQLSLNIERNEANKNITQVISNHTVPQSIVGKSFDELVKLYQASNYKSSQLDNNKLLANPTTRQMKEISSKMADYTIIERDFNGKTIDSGDIDRFKIRSEYEVKRLPEILDNLQIKYLIDNKLEFDSNIPAEESLNIKQNACKMASIESSLYLSMKQSYNFNGVPKDVQHKVSDSAREIYEQQDKKQKDNLELLNTNTKHSKDYNNIFARNYSHFDEITGTEPNENDLSLLHIITSHQLEQRQSNRAEVSFAASTIEQKITDKRLNNTASIIENIVGDNLIRNCFRNIDSINKLNLEEIGGRNEFIKLLQQGTIDLRRTAIKDYTKALYEIKNKETQEIQKQMQNSITKDREIEM